MDAGKLDRLVSIKARDAGQDAIGQPLTTWSLVATAWANIKYLSGLSALKAGADVSLTKTSIRIRYLAGINHGMRIESLGEVFDIQAILPVGRNEYLDLVCERVQ